MKTFTPNFFAATALTMFAAPSVLHAAPVGTQAGVDITNTVTASYEISGVTQTPIEADETFKVDRKVNVTLATVDTAAIAVSPGEASAVTTFTVTNTSNAALDFLLAATNQSGGAANFTGTDNFDPTNVQVYIETDGVSGLTIGSDTLASTIAEIASGDTATVYVVADMIISAGPPQVLPVNDDVATVILTATAAEGASAGTAITGLTGASAGSGGSAITETPAGTANGKMTEETVFADAAYAPSGDAQYNGQHAARSDYSVAGALLTINKYSRIVSDPVGSTNPRSIPGAIVEYCIVLANAAGGETATSVQVSDIVPSAMDFVPGSVFINGTLDAAETCTDAGGSAGSDAANYNAGTTTVTHSFASIAASQTRTVRFQAEIK